MTSVTDTPEARFWSDVEDSAREVRTWPRWRREAALMAIDPSSLEQVQPCSTDVEQCTGARR
jgi:hypothetical protein